MQKNDKKACSCGSQKNYSECCLYLDQGDALKQKGRYPAAATNYLKFLAIQPTSATAHNNLGMVLEAQGKIDDAIKCYQKAIFLLPSYAEAHLNLGSAYESKKSFVNAINCYQKAVSLQPEFLHIHSKKFASVYFKIGSTFEQQEKLVDAMAAYKQSLEFDNAHAYANYNLAILLRKQGKLAEAVASYDHAISAKADLMDAYYGLGEALQQMDKMDEAIACYEKALSEKPEQFEWNFHKFSARLPTIIESSTAIAKLHQNLIEEAETLINKNGRVHCLERAGFELFTLAYHGVDDKFLMEKIARLVRSKAHALSANHTKKSSTQTKDNRIKIAFISNFFYDHTVGKLTRGYIQNLDRKRFHVTVIHAPGVREDTLFNAINSSADQVLMLPHEFVNAQKEIAKLGLDILHYPDIGMSSYTYFLAFSRIALVQTVAWGHPLTTGLDTIDYYISFRATESEDAERYYTETLIRLNRAPFCEPEKIPTEIPSRTEAGLPATGTLYGCVQSLFKIHPDFDAIMADIVQLDPDGWIIMFEGTNPEWSKQLKKRWDAHFPRLSKRVIFIQRLPFTNYLKLIGNLDIFLDTIHFGSGMTFYQSLAHGIPTITFPGQFMRGKFVSGIYRWLGIKDAPIVDNMEDYAPLAVAYAKDSNKRASFKNQLQEKIAWLYNDELAIREYEEFFIQAVNAARAGEKLTNWNSGFNFPSEE